MLPIAWICSAKRPTLPMSSICLANRPTLPIAWICLATRSLGKLHRPLQHAWARVHLGGAQGAHHGLRDALWPRIAERSLPGLGRLVAGARRCLCACGIDE